MKDSPVGAAGAGVVDDGGGELERAEHHPGAGGLRLRGGTDAGGLLCNIARGESLGVCVAAGISAAGRDAPQPHRGRPEGTEEAGRGRRGLPRGDELRGGLREHAHTGGDWASAFGV